MLVSSTCQKLDYWLLRLPVSLGGLVIRSTLETRHAAFIGGVEQALPHFTNREGVCDQLNPFIGDFTGSKDTRWERLISSECRTGSEFAENWTIIKEEVSECHRYLEKIMDISPMNMSAQGAGDGREDGTTRKIIVQHREEVREAVLRESLSRKDGQSRQVIAWNNRDKLSTAWLQSLPGPDGFSNPEMSEPLALMLCMLSPACKD